MRSAIICTLSPAINGGAQCLLSSNMPVEEPFAVMHAHCSCIKLGRTQCSANISDHVQCAHATCPKDVIRDHFSSTLASRKTRQSFFRYWVCLSEFQSKSSWEMKMK